MCLLQADDNEYYHKQIVSVIVLNHFFTQWNIEWHAKRSEQHFFLQLHLR
jgi:hypothetical protein